MSEIAKLKRIHEKIQSCRLCPKMCGTPVHGPALKTSILLVGQAPGVHESGKGRPFAYTAGKTLFGWFQSQTGITEDQFRNKIYIASVARCFPGKSASGKGDREPSLEEIVRCREHLKEEVKILRPKLVIAVGKVAIAEVLGPEIFPRSKSLSDVVGKIFKAKFHGHPVEVVALPHPSGISIWPRIEPGKSLLSRALHLIVQHNEWQKTGVSLNDSTSQETHLI